LADRSTIEPSHPGDIGWRVALTLLLFSAIFWLGAATTRTLVGNHLLRAGTLELDQYLAPEAQREIFRLLSVTSIVVIIGYAGTVVSSLMFLWWSPFHLREHGWLMVGAILFYVFVPVEVYTMALDARMIYEEFFTTADNVVFQQLFLKRLTALNGAPIIATLCYMTIVVLAVFQPLRRRPTDAA